jgi:hypothetical protein
MRFVTIKSVEQQAILAWHSVLAYDDVSLQIDSMNPE